MARPIIAAMRKQLPLLLLALLIACGDDDSPAADGGASPDSDPNAPDADPNAPDADVPTCNDTVPGTPTLDTETVVAGFTAPVMVLIPPGETRLFVADKPGYIYIVENGQKRDPAFLDIDVLTDGDNPEGERGFLGMAFHPDYATNHRFYVYYNATNGDIKLAEYTATDANTTDPQTGTVLLTIAHSQFGNHNGGWIAFGPDKKLYMATGDGGSGGDPNGNGQKLSVLLAKVLRLDVDTAGEYNIPSDNPFVGMAGAKGEIWAYGVRNPWRNAFDSQTGDLYIADVGQDAIEEIDVQPANSTGGLNYGWNVMEGNACFEPSSGCNMGGKVLPIYQYLHSDFGDNHASITGGVVYRGCKMPGYVGHYFFGDAVHGLVRSLKWDGANSSTDFKEHSGLGTVPYCFGQDQNKELLMCDAASGSILRLIPKP
jgi:glucose/arabinose dehydrogenase